MTVLCLGYKREEGADCPFFHFVLRLVTPLTPSLTIKQVFPRLGVPKPSLFKDVDGDGLYCTTLNPDIDPRGCQYVIVVPMRYYLGVQDRYRFAT